MGGTEMKTDIYSNMLSRHSEKAAVLLKNLCGISLATLALASCTSRFEELNTNPNQVTAEQMEVNNYRTGTKITNLENLVVPTEEHIYQFVESLSGGPYAGYVGSTNIWQNSWETYNESADWRKWPFSNVMTEMYAPYRAVMSETNEDEISKALAMVMRVAIMHRVTDSYGPVPYSDPLNNQGLYIKYDSQQSVYTQMFADLDEAIAVLGNRNLNRSGWTSYDMVYYGDMDKWVRYANSLKLRMAMRLSYVAPELSRQKAEEAISGGVIESNDDNAQMHASANRAALIYNDWNDSRVAADIICYMNGYSDPRREKMFLPSVRDTLYAGVRVGSTVSREAFINAYSNLIVSSNTPYLWFNAAEAAFLKSEYELRWGDPGLARQYYEQGIALSFEEKGAEGAQAYIADNTSKPSAYTDPLGTYSVSTRPSEVTVAWDSTATDIEVNLEKIITQKWIAIFPLGVEGWSEYRRTGYPKLFDAAQDLSGGAVNVHHHARRLLYPAEEYTQNSENLQNAISTLNSEATGEGTSTGDNYATRLWWDVKPYND